MNPHGGNVDENKRIQNVFLSVVRSFLGMGDKTSPDTGLERFKVSSKR
jgi:hypothetical protein